MSDGACPKCERSRPSGAVACPRCGLVFARWQGSPSLLSSSSSAPLDDVTAALWSGVVAAWADEAKHDRFVRHCAGTGQLAAAGRQYRLAIDRDGAREGARDGAAGDPIAQRMREKIVTMASFALGQPPSARPAPRSIARSPLFLTVVGLALLAGTVGGLVYAR